MPTYLDRVVGKVVGEIGHGILSPRRLKRTWRPKASRRWTFSATGKTASLGFFDLARSIDRDRYPRTTLEPFALDPHRS